jgi:biopolymer transport protein ExbD
MAGVDVGGGGKGGRKSLDSEINMIPMIDLLMVTISFLLITAVWTHMARLEADAQVQSQQQDKDVEKPQVERILFIEMMPDKFVLTWKEGGVKVEPPGAIDVPRPPDSVAVSRQGSTEVVHYGDLAKTINEQWKANSRTQADNKKDLAILHCDNQAEYKYIIGVMDALYETKRVMGPAGGADGKKIDCSVTHLQQCETAFNVTFTSQ